MGFSAYEIWASSLLNDIDENLMSQEDFKRHQSVNHFCMKALVDARRCAYEFLKKSSSELSGTEAEGLIKLSEAFYSVYSESNKIYKQLSDGFGDTRFKWTRALREKQVDILRNSCIIEKEAVVLAKEILETC